MNKKYLEKIKQGMEVRIVKLCNEEEYYKPGDEGIVNHIDDAGQVHVSWANGGSIALLPLDGDMFDVWSSNEQVLKKVRENFKKKRGKWNILVGIYSSMNNAYVNSENVFNYLDTQFNEDEKDKFLYHKMVIGVTPTEDAYSVEIAFKK